MVVISEPDRISMGVGAKYDNLICRECVNNLETYIIARMRRTKGRAA
jgi:hypothetical protein